MKCGHCGKKMPKHILKAHIAKRHSPDLQELTSTTTKEKMIPTIFEAKKDWDWGELNTCQQCKEVWPSKLMEHHMAIRHGL
jgi:hypothetical protein